MPQKANLRMSNMKFNRFTRGILLAFSVLMLGLVLDISKVVALHAAPPSMQAHVLLAPATLTGQAQRMTSLPPALGLVPGLPTGAAITLTKYRMNTKLQGNVAITTITQTYKISSPHPHPLGHPWFFALMGA
jgi:hypothetical protein